MQFTASDGSSVTVFQSSDVDGEQRSLDHIAAQLIIAKDKTNEFLTQQIVQAKGKKPDGLDERCVCVRC